MPRNYTKLTDETKDKIAKGIAARGGAWNKGRTDLPKQTHCVRGHLRSLENLIRNNCKLCMKQWVIEHSEERKKIAREYSRRYRMQNLYNITEEQYAGMYAKQKGLCALPSCGNLATDIDHCHILEKTRGLLCNRHNKAIGAFSDSPKLLREAAEYLEIFHGQ